MFGSDRQDIRQTFFDAWQKHQNKQPIEPLESQIIDVLLMHPEYHYVLEDREDYLDRDYPFEEGKVNPFLHMGLHMSIREQISTDRPQGIADLYQQYCHKTGDPHDAEHHMMQCLVAFLRELQEDKASDEAEYLEMLKRQLG